MWMRQDWCHKSKTSRSYGPCFIRPCIFVTVQSLVRENFLLVLIHRLFLLGKHFLHTVCGGRVSVLRQNINDQWSDVIEKYGKHSPFCNGILAAAQRVYLLSSPPAYD